MRDDGYRSKWTGQHNTLLVDGRGQLGEGQQWFQGKQPLAVKSRPRILRATSTATLDYIVGDATEAYPADLGLKRFQRHLLFLKPDVLIVADDVQLKEPKALEVRFHPEQQTGRPDDGGFLFEGKSAVLRLEPLTPDAVQVDVEPLAIEGRHGEKDLTMLTVRLARTAAQWQNVVAFSWAPTGQQVKRVAMETQGDVTTFRCGHRVVSLDWSSPGATLEE